ncbi:hypothetical protein QTP88_027218 [Uroleucon formosanum]
MGGKRTRRQEAKIRTVASPKNCRSRVIGSYRTVSDMASLDLAKMPPVFLLANSRKRIAESRNSGNVQSKADETREIIRQWQREWDSTKKAAWTKRLIPDLERWWYRGLSQKRTQSPACSHCSAEVDDAEHTIFVCPFWDETRYELSQLLQRKPRPENVADMLCRPIIEKLPTDPIQRRRIQKAASRVASTLSQMVECIMGRKEELERIRQGVPLAAAVAAN